MKSVLLLALLALAGCATIDPAQVDPKILNAFDSRGVSDATLLKVRNGLPLTVGQVAEASQKGVPGPGLVSYMQSTRKAYNLSNADIATLRAAGRCIGLGFASIVEFTAHFSRAGKREAHYERSSFRFDEAGQRWYFVEGGKPKGKTVVKGAQVGRNDPCTCGSGKKFKKCCGAAA
jgi:hypothetical protein